MCGSTLVFGLVSRFMVRKLAMICPSAAVAYTFNKQSKQVWEDFEKGGNSGKHLRKFGGNSLQGGVFF